MAHAHSPNSQVEAETSLWVMAACAMGELSHDISYAEWELF